LDDEVVADIPRGSQGVQFLEPLRLKFVARKASQPDRAGVLSITIGLLSKLDGIEPHHFAISRMRQQDCVSVAGRQN